MTLVTVKTIKRKRKNLQDISEKKTATQISQIEIENHTGFAIHGYDIVCAAVSSATELVINTITESFMCECEVKITEEPPKIFLRVPEKFDCEKKSFAVAGLLDSFIKHLKNIEQNYPGNLRIKIVSD